MNQRLSGAIATLLLLSGCQQLQEQAQNLRKGGEEAVSSISQQAENIKTQALETKAAYETKSQQIMNAVDAVNKLTGTK